MRRPVHINTTGRRVGLELADVNASIVSSTDGGERRIMKRKTLRKKDGRVEVTESESITESEAGKYGGRLCFKFEMCRMLLMCLVLFLLP